ncbi:MAG TPA: SRPBCC family protein [Candidatus Limnocylindrales bacterium]|nr:SRPBCC family protein [Candidatus Limnocylindrales bacterium]
MDVGTLEAVGSRWRLTFVRRLDQSPATVWRAITEPDELAAWFPAIVEGDRVAGATLRFVFPRGDAPPSTGAVLAFDPPHVVELRWDADVLRFELRADGAGTELRFLFTFDELGRAARDGGGWHACLDNLDAHLAGGQPDPAAWERYEWAYVAALGPAASTIPPPERATD